MLNRPSKSSCSTLLCTFPLPMLTFTCDSSIERISFTPAIFIPAQPCLFYFQLVSLSCHLSLYRPPLHSLPIVLFLILFLTSPYISSYRLRISFSPIVMISGSLHAFRYSSSLLILFTYSAFSVISLFSLTSHFQSWEDSPRADSRISHLATIVLLFLSQLYSSLLSNSLRSLYLSSTSSVISLPIFGYFKILSPLFYLLCSLCF